MCHLLITLVTYSLHLHVPINTCNHCYSFIMRIHNFLFLLSFLFSLSPLTEYSYNLLQGLTMAVSTSIMVSEQRILFLPIGVRRILGTGFARRVGEENRWDQRRNDEAHHFCTAQNAFNLLLPLEIVRIVEFDRYDLFEGSRSRRSDAWSSICVHRSCGVVRR